jgi:hypothetical protein
MKKLYLIFGLCSLSVISIAQDKWDTDANILDNNARFGSKNNKGFKIVTDNQTTVDVDNSGKMKFKKKVEFENTFIADSIRVNNYLVADSIKTRIIKVGNNSLILGNSTPVPGSDNIQSTQGVINFGNNNPIIFPNINVSIGSQFVGPFTAARAKLFVNGRTGLNFPNPLSTLGVGGNQSLGAGFAGLVAPVNGLIVEGFSGAGTSNPLRQLDVFTPGNVPQMRVTRFTNTQFTDINVNNSGDYILLPRNTALAGNLQQRFVGIQTNTPGNSLEINSQATSILPGASGLRFTDLTSGSNTVTNVSGKVLSVNNLGDVILVPDGGGAAGPATVTAKNGLNVTVGPPDVELGGLLLHNTDIDMGNNYQMAWFNKGRHIFQDANSTVIPPGIYVPKIYVESNTYATSLELLTNLPSNINGTTYGQISRNQTKNGAANYGGFYEADGDQDAYGLSANSISSGLNANVYGAQCIANKGVLNIGGDFYANGDPLLTNKAFGVIGTAVNGISECNGVFGTALGNALLKKGVYGIVNSTLPSGSSFGIFGDASGGNSLSQPAFSRVYGVYGQSEYAVDNYGVYGTVLNSGVNGYAVYGDASNTNGFKGAVYAGYFNGNVNVNGTVTAFAYIPSDQNLKTNINPILNSKTIISQLQPKHFYYDTTKYFLNGVNKKNYGLIAQDVQNVLPELVSTYIIPDKKDSTGNVIANGGTFKTLNNNAFIGILLANAKEQNNRIDSLITALNSNSRVINPNQGPTNPATNVTTLNKQNVTLSNADMLVLDQNQPNPFSESTVIKYNVPEKYGYAQLIFTTIEGRILKTIDIAKKGAGEITVYANDLSNGIYTYTLVVDGKTVDSKKMVKQN